MSISARRLRQLLLAGLGLGLLAVAFAATRDHIGDVAISFRAIGWGLAGIVAIRLAALGLAGLAWRRIMPPSPSPGPSRLYIGLRLVREAINVLLPSAQVAGDMIGGRLLARARPGQISLGAAIAGILVDLLLQTATQGLFALLGLALLAQMGNAAPIVAKLGPVLLLAVPALGGFFLVQRFGLFMVVDRGLRLGRAWGRRLWPRHFSIDRSVDRPLDLQTSLRRIYGAPGALGEASLIHLAAWMLGSGEIQLALTAMGNSQGWREAFALESLGQAVRSAGFIVPGALGVQEAGYILLGGLFGLPASAALALSMAKRVPDLAIGLPGLVAWHRLEALPPTLESSPP